MKRVKPPELCGDVSPFALKRLLCEEPLYVYAKGDVGHPGNHRSEGVEWWGPKGAKTVVREK